jgi:hypothetical protein
MFIEVLESRTLLSASAIDPQVKADRLQIKADLLKFESDIAGGTATILMDCMALKADGIYQDATLRPLFKTLRTDVRSMNSQLKLDRLNQSSAALLDQSHIVTDLENILLDKGNKSEETANKAQLLSDRIALQNADVTGLNNRLATRQADVTQISNDLQAIVTAAQGDTGASAQLLADIQTFVTDKNTFLATISADITTLINDRNQLITDLTALQSQT